MKNKVIILILFIIIPSICVGNENIVGFELGEIFKDYPKYEDQDKKKVLDHLYQVNNVKFFDFVEIETDKNHIIRALSFAKEYKINAENLNSEKKIIINDFKIILKTVEKRFGKFDTSNVDMLNSPLGESNFHFMQKLGDMAINKKPKSKTVDLILIGLQSEECPNFMIGETKIITFYLIYTDLSAKKKMIKMFKERINGF